MSPAPPNYSKKIPQAGLGTDSQAMKSAPKQHPIHMKITKNTYVFDVKRKFSVSKKFKPKSVPVGIGKLMSVLPLGSTPGSKGIKKTSRQIGNGVIAGTKSSPQTAHPLYNSEIAKSFSKNSGKGSNPLIGFAIKAVAGFAIISLLLVGLLILIIPPAIPSAPAVQNLTVRAFTAQFPDMGVATFGNENNGMHTVYTQGYYNSSNLDSAQLSLRVYDKPVPSQIFVLSGERSRADSYPIFRKSLEKYLGQDGFSVSDLDPAYLDRLPANSVLIVPSGYMPRSLLGYTNPDFTFNDLIDRGVVVVYIGLRFDRFYLDDNGIILQTDKNIFDKLGLRFQPVRTGYSPADINATSLFDPTYEVISTNRPSKVIFAAVSVLDAGNGGAFVALPQTLDTGWSSNGDLAARDVANIVSEFVWMTPVASAYQTIALNDSPSAPFFIYTSPYANEGQYARFVSTAIFNDTKEKIGYGKNFIVWKRQNGELFSRSGIEVVSSYITDMPISLSADFRDPESGMKVLYIQTLKNGEIMRPPEALDKKEISLGSLFQFDYNPDLEPGVYLLRIVDVTGRIYAKSVLAIPDISIDVEKKDFARGDFQFSITSGARQKIKFSSASVAMNGMDERSYSSSDLMEYVTGPLDPGNYTFTIIAGLRSGRGITKEVTLPYVLSKTFLDDPVFLGLGLLAVIIFGAGVFLRIPEKEMFGLDIPDFPPIASIKIPIKKDTVISIFRQVNKDYSWEYMPLKLSEIKNAFRKLSHNGKSIIIGDYNLERVLDRIEKMDLVFNAFEFYGLSEWVPQSGRSAQYLCMFRQLRDIFVNSAVRFSPMLESEDYDIKFIAGQEVYVHIFDLKNEVEIKAFNTVSLGLTVIVFERDYDLDKFFASLSSTDDIKVNLKMELYQGRLKLVTVGKFSEFLKEIKPN